MSTLLFFGGFLVAWFVGVISGAFLLIAPLIIVFFALPFSFSLHREGALLSSAPFVRYTVSLVLLSSLFVLVSWSTWHFFPRLFVGYAIGVVLVLVGGVRKCGRNADNLTNYFQNNATYLNHEYIQQFLSQSDADRKD